MLPSTSFISFAIFIQKLNGVHDKHSHDKSDKKEAREREKEIKGIEFEVESE